MLMKESQPQNKLLFLDVLFISKGEMNHISITTYYLILFLFIELSKICSEIGTLFIV